ncbi:MAG: hypothetical protein NZL99_06200 [Burkholderiaceae bacterium]|nr:hypothetical protein [Burkholderiaceae bacterium]MCX8004724.1 hypothetical protein [Burkholderiaceae bacterium]
MPTSNRSSFSQRSAPRWFARSASVAAIALAGCAFAILDQRLPMLVAKPVDVAFDALGLPQRSQPMGTDTLYVWAYRTDSVLPMPMTGSAFTSGAVGPTGFYGFTHAMQVVPVPTTDHCEIRLQVDERQIVRRFDYVGTAFGCQFYANRLQSRLAAPAR